ncbi:MAG: hypothetical protein SFW09_21935 [Hyphomicrobiaceae bacterium]|nr:hypothetical protein [Hyphomicrobiaceae bacterium]
MRLKPGTFLWLVAHDLRLNWRRFVDMLGGMTPARSLGLGLLGVVGLHALAWPTVPRIAHVIAGPQSTPEARLALAVLLGTVVSWMAAQGLFAATRTLYDRGDLDLLYGSPQSPRRILAAKATAIALSSLGSVAMLALPVANVGAIRYGVQWLAAYPTLLGLALVATALALAVTVALFRLFGPRRARLYAHLGGAFIGGAIVLAAQVVAMLPDQLRASIAAALEPAAIREAGIVGRILWLPVDAMLAEPWAMAALLLAGAAMFAFAAWRLGGSFARACLEAAGAPSAGTAGRPTRPMRFRSGPSRALRRKEWRLLVRDPSLFAQLGLQIVYTIPLAVVLVRSGSLPIALALTPAIVVIAAQVAASLAWIAVSGEDAPELIAAAPVRPAAVDWAKLSAIAVPVLLVAAVPVGGLALASPLTALAALLFAAGASASTALLNLWHPMPGNRRGMLRRHAQSKLIGLLEHLLAILWAIAAVLALLGSHLWPLPVLMAAVVLGHGRLTSRGALGAGIGISAATPAPSAARALE